MTIAACYVSPEGVVFGSDSTASLNAAGGFHFFNHNQKLFELGNGDSTLAVVTWGLGGFGPISLRTLFVELADDLKATPPTTLQDVADRWATKIWAIYSMDPQLAPGIAAYRALAAKPPYDASAQPPDPAARSPDEEEYFAGLSRVLISGFCVGGYLLRDRVPGAFEIVLTPSLMAAPRPDPIAMNNWRFWGAPLLTNRLLYGCDDGLFERVIASPHWNGTAADLRALIRPGILQHPVLPIRDAIDFVHTCIYSTIKGMKFSAMPQICGGPVELAVITTDRPFRWVRHKEWDAAVWENG